MQRDFCPWRRGAGARGIIAIFFVVVAGITAGPAEADPSYTLIARGNAPVRSGALADGTQILEPSALAVRADGVIAFGTHQSGEVFWVQRGILSRVPVAAHVESDVGLAFAPDGTLLVTTCERADRPVIPSAVWRAAPGRPPMLVAGRPGRPRSSGDGGPATAARLECPRGVAVQADGGILIADQDAGRVRRVGPDGIIQTVAGTGRAGIDGDGGPALQAAIRPVDVAALPDGGFAIVQYIPFKRFDEDDVNTVRVVGANGIITTRSRFDAEDIAVEPNGALLAGSAGTRRGDGLVGRLAPDGRLSPITDLRRERVGIFPDLPIAGDPFGSDDEFNVFAVAESPDGGILFGGLFGDEFAIRYVPPPAPVLLAVGILPATRVPALRLTVAVRTTRAARVHVGVWARGRRAAYATAAVPGGDAYVPVSAPLRPGLYNVRVRAEGAGQVAAARADVLVGGLLPVRYARGFIGSRLELFRVFQDEPRSLLRCHRIERRRVDCGVIQHRRCAAVVTVRVQADGTLAVAQYRGGRGRRCRFRR